MRASSYCDWHDPPTSWAEFVILASASQKRGTTLCYCCCASQRESFEDRSMLRRIGVAILYFITIGYLLSILMPSVYCFSHGCKGPGELDAFMPAFLFTPLGAITTALSLNNAIHQIRKGQSPWVFWPLAIIFATVLLGVAALFAIIIYHTAFHR